MCVNPRVYVIFLKLRSSRHHMLPEDWQNKVRSVNGVSVLASSSRRLRISAEDTAIQEVVRRVRAHCVIDLEGSPATTVQTGTLPLGILDVTPEFLRETVEPYAKALARDLRAELTDWLRQYADGFDRLLTLHESARAEYQDDLAKTEAVPEFEAWCFRHRAWSVKLGNELANAWKVYGGVREVLLLLVGPRPLVELDGVGVSV